MTSFKCVQRKHKILLSHTHTHIHKATVKLGEIIAHNYLKTTARATTTTRMGGKATITAATANKIKLSSKQTDCIALMKQLRSFPSRGRLMKP